MTRSKDSKASSSFPMVRRMFARENQRSGSEGSSRIFMSKNARDEVDSPTCSSSTRIAASRGSSWNTVPHSKQEES